MSEHEIRAEEAPEAAAEPAEASEAVPAAGSAPESHGEAAAPAGTTPRASTGFEPEEEVDFVAEPLGEPVLGPRDVFDVRLRLTAELGRARLPVAQVVGLGSGAIVDLDRAPDDPVDVYVNGMPYAIGRLILVGEEWAVRIEEVLPEVDTDDPADQRRAGERSDGGAHADAEHCAGGNGSREGAEPLADDLPQATQAAAVGVQAEQVEETSQLPSDG